MSDGDGNGSFGGQNLGLFLRVDMMNPVNRLDFVRSPVTVAVLNRRCQAFSAAGVEFTTTYRSRSWSWKKLGRSNESLVHD